MAKSECHRYGFGRLVSTFGDADTPMFGITFGGWVSVFMVPDIRLGYKKVTTNRLKDRFGNDTVRILKLFCFNLIWSVP